ncbi:carbamoyltransferase HypF [Streptomonospora litoralis]|uniref:Carbamoyltransferase n=1 Tax=Streptomonospora litoralis TaxID=2498135 RepID=A0A4P6PZG8_9ACTN|nr:carbamoyltransferase HypF [Streptomonospora litoralis]QBI53543.1 Carbamoyltransferase HypF [Streptomonospora litoralis]
MGSGEPFTRSRIRVEGIVQGVGFRPFVHALATRHRLSGLVGNDARGVYVEVEGPREGLGRFRRELVEEAPPLAVIERVSAETLAPLRDSGFRIVASDGAGERQALVPPDVATCDACLAELFDPGDRRYRYPFTNCTDCGPRFTIVTDLPYDRPATTMAGFAMCAACEAEYRDPADRRFHAQPVCCPACGPRLRLVDAAGADAAGTDGADPAGADPVAAAARALVAGRIVAVKGLGGYHLAADAGDEAAVAALRARKRRAAKPFAVMAASLEAAERLCEVEAAEAAVLTGSRRPIVPVLRRPGAEAELAPSTAPGDPRVGVMLPYTPLHHLLAAEHPRPFVLTSGNVSDEPIARTEEEALARLGTIADVFLVHDRPIHVRTDDSVVRLVRGREYPLRRARGYAPAPLTLPVAARRPVLACGAELKSTFCLAGGDRAFLSQHIGDLEDYAAYTSYTEQIAHLSALFGIDPQTVAHDLHPDYLSTKYALGRAGAEPVAVQHHHAHIAACMADNGRSDPVVGLALDGLGYGCDGTLWGGELLVGDLRGMRRHGHLARVPMPGGAAAVREPWRMAAAYLDAAYGGRVPEGFSVVRRNAARWAAVVGMARSGTNAPPTSSAGRLFDAVAALAGLGDAVDYEGQAAIELERRADPREPGIYPARIDDPGIGGEEAAPLRIGGTDLVRAAAQDVLGGAAVPAVAARFHNGLAGVLAEAVQRVCSRTGVATVALSGGVFQNTLLLELLCDRLEAADLHVLTHRRVPANDGGISFGQAAVAAALDAVS